MGGTDEALLKLLAEQQRTIERLTAALERMAPAAEKPEAAGPTFGDVFKRYAKVKAATNPKFGAWRYQFVVKHFAKKRAAAIDGESWAEYSTLRLTGELTEGRKVSHNTVNNELDLTNAALNWAVGQRLIPSNQLTLVKKTKVTVKSQGALREEHLQTVLKAAPNQITRAYILLAFDTGLRRCELLALTWDDIDESTLTVRVVAGKGMKAGIVIGTKRSFDGLLSLPRRRNTDPIFMNGNLNRAYHSTQMNAWVKQAMTESGIEKFYGGAKIRIHALRHGHATNTIEAGVPLHEVKAQLRHSSIAVTERYLHERLDRRRESMATKYEARLDDRRGPHRAANHDLEDRKDAREKRTGQRGVG